MLRLNHIECKLGLEKGAQQAEASGYLFTAKALSHWNIMDYIMVMDAKRVYSVLSESEEKDCNNMDPLEIYKLHELSKLINDAGGRILWLPNKEIKVVDRLNKILVDDYAPKQFMSRYYQLRQIRKYSTCSRVN